MGKSWWETCKGCGFKHLVLEDKNDPNSWVWECKLSNPRVKGNKGCVNKPNPPMNSPTNK